MSSRQVNRQRVTTTLTLPPELIERVKAALAAYDHPALGRNRSRLIEVLFEYWIWLTKHDPEQAARILAGQYDQRERRRK